MQKGSFDLSGLDMDGYGWIWGDGYGDEGSEAIEIRVVRGGVTV